MLIGLSVCSVEISSDDDTRSIKSVKRYNIILSCSSSILFNLIFDIISVMSVDQHVECVTTPPHHR
jgi:hypothetical protein